MQNIHIHIFMLYCSTVILDTKYMKRKLLFNQGDS